MYSCENFISYRRHETVTEVKMIYDALVKEGHPTFCDIYDLKSGDYQKNLLKAIDCCTNFILVLKSTTLDLCLDSSDWLYREIREALEQKKNIICVFVGEANFPESLPLEIQEIRWQNGLSFDIVYFTSFIDRLISKFIACGEFPLESSVDHDFIIDETVLIEYVGSAKFVNIPDGVEVIGENAFKNASTIETITFPASVKRIQPCAFEHCISLTNLMFPTSLLEIGNRAFYRCHSLTFILFNNLVESIEDEAFAFCDSLKFVQFTSSLRKISPSAFNNCSQLAQFSVPQSNLYFSTIDGILYDYNQLTLIRCPENYKSDVVYVPNSVKILGPWAFSGCTNLVSIILSNNISKISAFSFYDCNNLTSLSLPDSVIDFDERALEGWHYPQRVVMGKSFNPRIRYIIEKKMQFELYEKELSDLENKYIIIRTTFESKHEATHMAKMLLDNHLITVGQISPCHSIYMWKECLVSEEESVLWGITEAKFYCEIEDFIRSHHSYDLCEFLIIPISYLPTSFSEWISEWLEN